MNKVNNNHKVKGAFVWHEGEIQRITKSDSDINGDVILENRIRLKRNRVKLVRIGDELCLKKSLVNTLPDRMTYGKCLVTHIRENGMIGTNKDAHEFDDTNYNHFQKWGHKRIVAGGNLMP